MGVQLHMFIKVYVLPKNYLKYFINNEKCSLCLNYILFSYVTRYFTMANSQEKNIFQYMEEFLIEHPVNPVTQARVIVAKDVTFAETSSEYAYNLLLPLSMVNTYAYIKTYICDQTSMPKNVLVVVELPKIDEDGGNYIFTPPVINDEKWKFVKGVRYVPRMLEFFSPSTNPMLYNAVHNSNVLVPPLKIYDTDKVQYQSGSGYLEIIHQSTCFEGETYPYLLLKSFRSKTANSAASAPRVFTLLHEEFAFFKEFLSWAQETYSVTMGDASVEQARVRSATLGIHNILSKRKGDAVNNSEKINTGKRTRKAPGPKKPATGSKPKQVQRETNDASEGVNASAMMAGLKALGRQQAALKIPTMDVQPASNYATAGIIDIEENAQVFDYSNAYE